jgi:hypothetical protein
MIYSMILYGLSASVVKNHGDTECTEMHRVDFMICSMILYGLSASVVKNHGDTECMEMHRVEFMIYSKDLYRSEKRIELRLKGI